ncbi:hypothetical protein EDB95_0458 [Dinghuibacter silviterrae]|uniref:DUF7674 domain-containing protein n=2 Tax=Dinghuibacter silviterrae TaxID=1539049 RepID=A0A4R8DNQ9_9BACT|nr:hypothetical protein EDB95_0458 [Dinghuibacter silviterrae]
MGFGPEHRMINQYEVAACLKDELPQVSRGLSPLAALDVVANIQELTDYARKMASLMNLKEVRKCMVFAEKMYGKGNKYVRDVIENVFVFSFSTLFLGDRPRRKQLQALIPLSLYSVYVRQITAP